MAETYEILYADAVVGTAQMEKEGLYYRFCCRCSLPDQGLYRIHVISGDHRENLGICIPVDGAFGMDKKIPIKRFVEEKMAFRLVPKDWSPPVAQETAPETVFVPVSEDAPVEYLDKLEYAVLEERDEQIGFVIPNDTQLQPER